MSRNVGSLFLVALCNLAALSLPAAAEPVSAFCYREHGQVVCDVRPGQAKSVSSITATVNQKEVKGQYEAFDPASRRTAWYFLIQQSANPKDSAQAVSKIANYDGRRDYGVATFADKLDERAPIGASRGDINKLRDKLTGPAGSDRTYLFQAAREGVAKLVAYPAERKALVLFADGRSDSSDRSEYREQVVKAAGDNNILVYGVFMNRKNATNSEEPTLKRLTEDVPGGIFRVAADCKKSDRCTTVELPDDVTKDFLQYLEKGGTLKLSSSDVPSSAEFFVNVNFTDGTTARTPGSVLVRSGPPPGNQASGQQRWWEEIADWVMRNQLMAGAFGAIGMGLLLLTGYAMSRRAQQPAYAGGGYGGDQTAFDQTGRHGGGTLVNTVLGGSDTVIFTPTIDRNPPHQVYAWLQFLDADARRVPIGSTNVRIGRGQDNDIILQNKTVHRQHAVIKRSPDGGFSIHHLGGENIVMVNGQPTNQRGLTNNDMIELGEVRMRFFANA